MTTVLPWFAHTRGWSVLWRHAATIALVAATFLLRAVLWENHASAVFLPYFVPIIAATVVFDRGSGFLAVAACAALIAFPQRLPFAAEPAPLAGPWTIVLFVAIGFACVAAIGSLHTARESLSRSVAALQESEARFQAFIEDAPHKMWVTRPDGAVEFFNRAWRDYTGLAASSAGQWEDVTHPEDRQRLWATRAAGLSGTEPYSIELRLRRADGAYRWHASTVTPLRRGNETVAWVGTSVDVDDARATFEKLRASEESNRLIVENARGHAILTTDLDGTITSWSGGAEAIFGYAAAEAIGDKGEIIFTPEDREAGAPAAEMAAARRDGSAPDLRWHQRKDGSRLWFEGVLSTLHDSAGREVGFLKIGRDETAAHRAEQLLREATERQALLTREVGHRVKNNLAIIAGMLSLQGRAAAHAETRQALGEAQGRIAAIAQVHDHLWRQDSTDVLDLDAFLGELCARMQPTVPRHALRYEGLGAPLTVPVDRAVTLSLIVNELVTNAAKYAYPQSGGAITIGLARPEGAIRIWVADEGVGMAPPGAEPLRSGFGSRLLTSYAKQLDAKLLIDGGRGSGKEGGTRVSLLIPLDAIVDV